MSLCPPVGRCLREDKELVEVVSAEDRHRDVSSFAMIPICSLLKL